MADGVHGYIAEHLGEGIEELKRLCRSRSVSAQGEGAETAELVAEMLEERGLKTHLIPTSDGNPVVYGEAEGKSDATLLLYNHYDVQPVEPLELWDSPPFEPEMRGDHLYGRGVDDDKGHIASRLLMLDAFRDVHGEFPCRIKWLIEGQEECGSGQLGDVVRTNKVLLAADACVWESGGVDHEDHPSLYLGLRGIVYIELRCKTGTLDAHSGMAGSIFPNAAWRLVWAISTLKDTNERIQIAGHYDRVRPANETDLAMLEKLPSDEAYLKGQYGVKGYLQDAMGLEFKRRSLFEPTLTLCGLTAGYQGPGSKTVLPAEASAKMDFRLVPDMRPEDVLAGLRRHLDAHGFSDIEIEYHGGEAPARVDPNHPVARLMVDAAAEVYGKEPRVWPFMGGSGPMHPFVEALGVPVVSNGIGWPGGRIHAPNENIRMDDFKLGTQHIARFWEQFPAVVGK